MFTSMAKSLGALTHSPFGGVMRLAHQQAGRYLEQGGAVATKAVENSEKPFPLPADIDTAAVSSAIKQRVGKPAPTGAPILRLGARAFVPSSWLRRLGGGEVVRVAFALDCHDREAISWVATTAGISGEMIRDMMVRSVEQRFGSLRAPHPVQWLSDNGSIFAAHKTIETALALGLVPCFTPVESPESNGMAEAFVKTVKRDYVRVSPIPDAATALALIDSWMEDYNTVHPHSRLGYRSPREYILSQPVACPV